MPGMQEIHIGNAWKQCITVARRPVAVPVSVLNVDPCLLFDRFRLQLEVAQLMLERDKQQFKTLPKHPIDTALTESEA